jgi:hypothetical protein
MMIDPSFHARRRHAQAQSGRARRGAIEAFETSAAPSSRSGQAGSGDRRDAPARRISDDDYEWNEAGLVRRRPTGAQAQGYS